jgi:nicotinamide-nucleotide amidase
VSATAVLLGVGLGTPVAEGAWAAVAAALAAGGLPPAARLFIEDDEGALERALTAEPALIVVITGDAGSAGERVRRAVARSFRARLVLSERMRGALEEAWRRRDRPVPRRAERLALLPQGAAVWTAPGAEPAWALEGEGRAVVVLSRGGETAHLPALSALARTRAGARPQALRTLRVVGLGLDEVEDRLGEWLGPSADAVEVSTLAAPGEVWVRLRARGATVAAAHDALGEVERQLRARLGEDCYGADQDTLEEVVGRLLTARALTLAVAESCTGGLLGQRITSVPGASRYFEGGVVAYANRVKTDLLGVPADLLRIHGAVSGPCAEAMAAGVRRVVRADCALAVTGIAGPEGGTPGRPVGTVWIGVAVGDRVTTHRFLFAGDRLAITWQSAHAALDLLRRRLLGQGRP